MSLWDWAVSAYERPGAADACLALQDRHGQSVCLLLWAVWANPDEAALPAAAGLAREWEEAVLKPLRGVRRRLPAGPLREEVKAVELKAERALLDSLERLTPPIEGDPLEALSAASAVWGAPAPRAALKRLAEAVLS